MEFHSFPTSGKSHSNLWQKKTVSPLRLICCNLWRRTVLLLTMCRCECAHGMCMWAQMSEQARGRSWSWNYRWWSAWAGFSRRAAVLWSTELSFTCVKGSALGILVSRCLSPSFCISLFSLGEVLSVYSFLESPLHKRFVCGQAWRFFFYTKAVSHHTTLFSVFLSVAIEPLSLTSVCFSIL